MFRNFLSHLFNTVISGALSFPGLVDAGFTSDGAACEARGLQALPLAFCVTQEGLVFSLGLSFSICKITIISSCEEILRVKLMDVSPFLVN